MKPRKVSFGTHVGTSLILLIFMVLCLISFATLSLVNATADWRLTNKLAVRQNSYYTACHSANAFIAARSALLRDLKETSADEASFTERSSELELSDRFPVAEDQYLQVELSPDYTADNGCLITSYRIISERSVELDETLPLYTGSN